MNAPARWLLKGCSAAAMMAYGSPSTSASARVRETNFASPGVFAEDSMQAEIFEDPLPVFAKKQILMAGYGLSLSLFSPLANLRMLKAVYPSIKAQLHESPGLAYRLCASIYGQQVLLRIGQVNLSSPVKEHLSPWLAFGVMGVLQGGVYGHANVHFARKLGIDRTLTMGMIFRGSWFAFTRDMISQGIPFMFSETVREKVLDGVVPATDAVSSNVKHWGALIGTSVVATYMSHGLHNCQTAMQTNHEMTSVGAFRSMVQKHGVSFLWKGAEARVGLLLVTNIFNEIFLKPVWQGHVESSTAV